MLTWRIRRVLADSGLGVLRFAGIYIRRCYHEPGKSHGAVYGCLRNACQPTHVTAMSISPLLLLVPPTYYSRYLLFRLRRCGKTQPARRNCVWPHDDRPPPSFLGPDGFSCPLLAQSEKREQEARARNAKCVIRKIWTFWGDLEAVFVCLDSLSVGCPSKMD